MKVSLKLTVVVAAVFCVLVLVDSEEIKKGLQDGANEQIVFPNDFSIGQYPSRPNRDQPAYHYHHYHHNHPDLSPNFQHNPYFHRGDNTFGKNNEEDQKVQGYDDEQISRSDEEAYGYNNLTMDIPLNFIQNINKYNVSDLLLNYIESDVDYEDSFIASRFAEDGQRGGGVIPKAAGCAPETKTVKLVYAEDPTILYIPQCTRVQRCGGCCSHTLLSCQPTKTENLTYQVLKTKYTGGKKLKLLGKELIEVEQHLSCKCDCKVKAEHCLKYQEYRPSECRCACTNTDEEKKCYKNNAQKLWNPESCSCQCKDVFQCSSGQYYDQQECRCLPSAVRRRYATFVTETSPLEDIVN